MPTPIASRRLALALAASLTLASCAPAQPLSPAGTFGNDAGASNSPISPLVSGLVNAGAVLSGATATLTGDGKVIASGPVRSNMYLFQVASVPASYRVTVNGGTLDGKPFTGELRAEHRADSELEGGPEVDWLSTLASRSMQAHPGQSLHDALKAVKNYLQIPDTAAAEFWEEVHGHFDNAAFYAANGQDIVGAVDRAVAGVASGQQQAYMPAAEAVQVAETGTLEPLANGDTGIPVPNPDATPPATYAVKALPPSYSVNVLGAGIGVAAAKFVGENLGGAALGAATDFVLNLLLGGSDSSADLTAVSDKLDKLLAAVDQVQLQVEQVQNTVRETATFSDYNNSYNTLVNEQVLKLDTMDNYHERLADMLRKDSGYTAGEVASLRAEIIRYEDGVFQFPQETLTRWEKGVTAMLPLGARYVAAREANYILPSQSLDHFNQWLYFDGLQAKMITYLITYLTAKKNSTTSMRDYLQQWQAIRGREMATLRSVPSTFAVDNLAVPNFGVANVSTTINALPEGTMVDRVNKRFFKLKVLDKVKWALAESAMQQVEINFVPYVNQPLTPTTVIVNGKYPQPTGWKMASVADQAGLHKDGSKYRSFASLGYPASMDTGNACFWTNAHYADSLTRLRANSVSIGPAYGVNLSYAEMVREPEFVSAVSNFSATQPRGTWVAPASFLTGSGYLLPDSVVPQSARRIRTLQPYEQKVRDVDIALCQDSQVKTVRTQFDLRPDALTAATWSNGLYVMSTRAMTTDEASSLLGSK